SKPSSQTASPQNGTLALPSIPISSPSFPSPYFSKSFLLLVKELTQWEETSFSSHSNTERIAEAWRRGSDKDDTLGSSWKRIERRRKKEKDGEEADWKVSTQPNPPDSAAWELLGSQISSKTRSVPSTSSNSLSSISTESLLSSSVSILSSPLLMSSLSLVSLLLSGSFSLSLPSSLLSYVSNAISVLGHHTHVHGHHTIPMFATICIVCVVCGLGVGERTWEREKMELVKKPENSGQSQTGWNKTPLVDESLYQLCVQTIERVFGIREYPKWTAAPMIQNSQRSVYPFQRLSLEKGIREDEKESSSNKATYYGKRTVLEQIWCSAHDRIEYLDSHCGVCECSFCKKTKRDADLFTSNQIINATNGLIECLLMHVLKGRKKKYWSMYQQEYASLPSSIIVKGERSLLSNPDLLAKVTSVHGKSMQRRQTVDFSPLFFPSPLSSLLSPHLQSHSRYLYALAHDTKIKRGLLVVNLLQQGRLLSSSTLFTTLNTAISCLLRAVMCVSDRRIIATMAGMLKLCLTAICSLYQGSVWKPETSPCYMLLSASPSPFASSLHPSEELLTILCGAVGASKDIAGEFEGVSSTTTVNQRMKNKNNKDIGENITGQSPKQCPSISFKNYGAVPYIISTILALSAHFSNETLIQASNLLDTERDGCIIPPNEELYGEKWSSADIIEKGIPSKSDLKDESWKKSAQGKESAIPTLFSLCDCVARSCECMRGIVMLLRLCVWFRCVVRFKKERKRSYKEKIISKRKDVSLSHDPLSSNTLASEPSLHDLMCRFMSFSSPFEESYTILSVCISLTEVCAIGGLKSTSLTVLDFYASVIGEQVTAAWKKYMLKKSKPLSSSHSPIPIILSLSLHSLSLCVLCESEIRARAKERRREEEEERMRFRWSSGKWKEELLQTNTFNEKGPTNRSKSNIKSNSKSTLVSGPINPFFESFDAIHDDEDSELHGMSSMEDSESAGSLSISHSFSYAPSSSVNVIGSPGSPPGSPPVAMFSSIPRPPLFLLPAHLLDGFPSLPFAHHTLARILSLYFDTTVPSYDEERKKREEEEIKWRDREETWEDMEISWLQNEKTDGIAVIHGNDDELSDEVANPEKYDGYGEMYDRLSPLSRTGGSMRGVDGISSLFDELSGTTISPFSLFSLEPCHSSPCTLTLIHTALMGLIRAQAWRAAERVCVCLCVCLERERLSLSGGKPSVPLQESARPDFGSHGELSDDMTGPQSFQPSSLSSSSSSLSLNSSLMQPVDSDTSQSIIFQKAIESLCFSVLPSLSSLAVVSSLSITPAMCICEGGRREKWEMNRSCLCMVESVRPGACNEADHPKSIDGGNSHGSNRLHTLRAGSHAQSPLASSMLASNGSLTSSSSLSNSLGYSKSPSIPRSMSSTTFSCSQPSISSALGFAFPNANIERERREHHMIRSKEVCVSSCIEEDIIPGDESFECDESSSESEHMSVVDSAQEDLEGKESILSIVQKEVKRTMAPLKPPKEKYPPASGALEREWEEAVEAEWAGDENEVKRNNREELRRDLDEWDREICSQLGLDRQESDVEKRKKRVDADYEDELESGKDIKHCYIWNQYPSFPFPLPFHLLSLCPPSQCENPASDVGKSSLEANPPDPQPERKDSRSEFDDVLEHFPAACTLSPSLFKPNVLVAISSLSKPKRHHNFSPFSTLVSFVHSPSTTASTLLFGGARACDYGPITHWWRNAQSLTTVASNALITRKDSLPSPYSFKYAERPTCSLGEGCKIKFGNTANKIPFPSPAVCVVSVQPCHILTPPHGGIIRVRNIRCKMERLSQCCSRYVSAQLVRMTNIHKYIQNEQRNTWKNKQVGRLSVSRLTPMKIASDSTSKRSTKFPLSPGFASSHPLSHPMMKANPLSFTRKGSISSARSGSTSLNLSTSGSTLSIAQISSNSPSHRLNRVVVSEDLPSSLATLVTSLYLQTPREKMTLILRMLHAMLSSDSIMMCGCHVALQLIDEDDLIVKRSVELSHQHIRKQWIKARKAWRAEKERL
ncbi:hypothetical protein ADUPG1_000729, partial [Aduncisulcus paluster]